MASGIKIKITAQKLQAKVDQYFKTSKRPTLESLFIYVGLNRHIVYDWKPEDPRVAILRDARERIIAMLTEIIIYQQKHPLVRMKKGVYWNPIGAMWYLKNIDKEHFQDAPQVTEAKREANTIHVSFEKKGTNRLVLPEFNDDSE